MCRMLHVWIPLTNWKMLRMNSFWLFMETFKNVRLVVQVEDGHYTWKYIAFLPLISPVSPLTYAHIL